MKIEFRKPKELIPYANNPRTHTDEQISQLMASIREFGFTNPVLVDGESTIIAGHGRVIAALRLGLDEVPTIENADMTEAQRRAYVIADNRLAENAGWDDELLALELGDLQDLNFDVSLTGFSQDELDELQASIAGVNEGLTDPVDVPEVQEKIITQSGDVWVLGRHRLMCGDSTRADDVAALMNGNNANLCLTDPPYGLGDKKASGKNNYDIHKDTQENLISLIAGWLPIARKMCKTVIFSPGVTNLWLYPKADWVMSWFYGGGQLRSHWGFNCWQPFLCFGKDPSLATGNGGRPDAVDMNTPANAGDIDHPCPKPIKLWMWFINRMSFNESDIFFEPFSGSGTTIIAAEQTGRACYAMEISPQYVDVAVRRWQAFTGQQATLESSGKAFMDDD